MKRPTVKRQGTRIHYTKLIIRKTVYLQWHSLECVTEYNFKQSIKYFFYQNNK